MRDAALLRCRRAAADARRPRKPAGGRAARGRAGCSRRRSAPAAGSAPGGPARRRAARAWRGLARRDAARRRAGSSPPWSGWKPARIAHQGRLAGAVLADQRRAPRRRGGRGRRRRPRGWRRSSWRSRASATAGRRRTSAGTRAVLEPRPEGRRHRRLPARGPAARDGADAYTARWLIVDNVSSCATEITSGGVQLVREAEIVGNMDRPRHRRKLATAMLHRASRAPRTAPTPSPATSPARSRATSCSAG